MVVGLGGKTGIEVESSLEGASAMGASASESSSKWVGSVGSSRGS